MGLLVLMGVARAEATAEQESYLSWTADQAVKVGKSMREEGRVGGDGFRVLSTERAKDY